MQGASPEGALTVQLFQHAHDSDMHACVRACVCVCVWVQGNKAETVGGCVYLWRTSGIKGDSQGRPVLPPDQPRATHNVSGCTFRNNYAGIVSEGALQHTD